MNPPAHTLQQLDCLLADLPPDVREGVECKLGEIIRAWMDAQNRLAHYQAELKDLHSLATQLNLSAARLERTIGEQQGRIMALEFLVNHRQAQLDLAEWEKEQAWHRRYLVECGLVEERVCR